MQNILAQVVSRAPWTVSSVDICPDLQWLPVSHRVTFKLCLISWKTLHTAHPPYLSELITHYHPSRALHSCNTNLLARPAGITGNFGHFLFPHHPPGTHCLHTSTLLTNYQPSNINRSLTSSSLLLPSSHPGPAPQIRLIHDFGVVYMLSLIHI